MNASEFKLTIAMLTGAILGWLVGSQFFSVEEWELSCLVIGLALGHLSYRFWFRGQDVRDAAPNRDPGNRVSGNSDPHAGDDTPGNGQK